MNKPDDKIINQEWCVDELELVDNCPYCHSTECSIAYEGVQDFTFYSAPGKWSYWNCKNCEALYLNPRPKEEYIHKAYLDYYTHNPKNFIYFKSFLMRLKNEFYSYVLNIDINPRLKLPIFLRKFLPILKKYIKIPFVIAQLAEHNPGNLLDIGCGDGLIISKARMLGWSVTGIELDPKAVSRARSTGLNVVQGSFSEVDNLITTKPDLIICSHILEHLHQPKELLDKLVYYLKLKNTTLLLSTPNSTSQMRYMYNSSWRGLEAPRHIAIAEINFLKKYFANYGFSVKEIVNSDLTEKESILIAKTNKTPICSRQKFSNNSDIIQLVIKSID